MTTEPNETPNAGATPPPESPTPPPQQPPQPPPQTPPPQTPPPQTPPPSVGPSAEERQWAMFAHISALLGLVIPFGSVVAPLVIWLMKKDTMPFVDDQGKEALNFQLTVAIIMIACFLTIWLVLPIVLMIIVGIGALVLTIIAAIKANEGVSYRYPVSWRMIK